MVITQKKARKHFRENYILELCKDIDIFPIQLLHIDDKMRIFGNLITSKPDFENTFSPFLTSTYENYLAITKQRLTLTDIQEINKTK